MPEFPEYHIPMDIRPPLPCEYCENDNWHISIVDTSFKIDLYTGQRSNFYTGSNICKKCNITTYWKIEPDKPYPPSDEFPHERRKQ